MMQPNESQFLKVWGGFTVTVAKDVRNPAALGMDTDDVVADLQVTLLEAARSHHDLHEEYPRPGLVKTILRRRAMVLNRNSLASRRGQDRMPVMDQEGMPFTEMIPAQDDTEEEAVRTETRKECLALLVHLRARMQPKDFALLYVRFVEELGPSVIARSTSDDNRRIGAKLIRARDRARGILTELGVWSWRDIEEGTR